jgi:hypothetical protein
MVIPNEEQAYARRMRRVPHAFDAQAAPLECAPHNHFASFWRIGKSVSHASIIAFMRNVMIER